MRHRSFQVRVTEVELARFRAAALARGLTLSGWVRFCLTGVSDGAEVEGGEVADVGGGGEDGGAADGAEDVG